MAVRAEAEYATRTSAAPTKRRRIVVLGYIIRAPLGGLVWHHLQYVAGLARLGHEVLFVEDSEDYPSCVHLDRDELDIDPSDGLAFAADAFAGLGIDGRFAYACAHTGRWLGPAANDAEEFCRSAEIVLNVSGINPVRDWWREAPVRVLIDTDPAFVQIRHIQSTAMREAAATHNAFFTYGENFGKPGCSIPNDGFDWRPTRQPVVLEAWTSSPPPAHGPFSTVMQWSSYKQLTHDGVKYGMKRESFDPYRDLPSRTGIPLLLAIGGADRGPRRELEAAGWRVRNAIEITRTPWDYRQFIGESAGEFTVAKHGYVISRSGWFSERSANYLASGRPVIVQDTGIGDILPCGEGILAFSNPEAAREALHAVASDPERHSRAARQIAETHFDSSRILSELIETAVAAADGARRTS